MPNRKLIKVALLLKSHQPRIGAGKAICYGHSIMRTGLGVTIAGHQQCNPCEESQHWEA